MRPRYTGDDEAIIAALARAAHVPDFLKWDVKLPPARNHGRFHMSRGLRQELVMIKENIILSQKMTERITEEVSFRATHWPRPLSDTENIMAT